MALTAAINKLPAAHRTVLVLCDVQGLSNLETAELLSLSVSAVKTRVHRARLFLRKELGNPMTTLDVTTTPKRRLRITSPGDGALAHDWTRACESLEK